MSSSCEDQSHGAGRLLQREKKFHQMWKISYHSSKSRLDTIFLGIVVFQIKGGLTRLQRSQYPSSWGDLTMQWPLGSLQRSSCFSLCQICATLSSVKINDNPKNAYESSEIWFLAQTPFFLPWSSTLQSLALRGSLHTFTALVEGSSAFSTVACGNEEWEGLGCFIK